MMLIGMEHKRIQKLLLSEYCDFSDTVLVESPFAETTRDGRGLRQVALGLTPTRLVVAADILKKNSEFMCPPDLDPSIESFELVSVYPLEFVTLSVFRRRKRRTLKARLIDGRANYYELGGMECRNTLWTIWCSHVRDLLAKKETGSSMSETTAASSSSASSLYLLSSGVEFKENTKIRGSKSQCRVWAHYGGAGDGQLTSWPRKDVYLGPSYDELTHGYYTPIPVRFAGASLEDLSRELKDATPKSLMCRKTCGSWPCPRNSKSTGKTEFDRKTGSGLCDVLFTREGRRTKRRNRQEDDCSPTLDRHRGTASETSAAVAPLKNSCKHHKHQKRKSGSPRKHGTSVAPKLSRFGFGVQENCSSGLYLEPWEGDREHFRHGRSGHANPEKLIDSGVRIWENHEDIHDKSRKKSRHPRRYGLATAAHFFHALGPWSVQPGERESVQRRRASSAVGIRRQPIEPELRLPVSKRQLAASVSMTSLEPGKCGGMGSSTRGRVILFWTPEYWYRPRAATAAYRELRKHLGALKDFRAGQERVNRKTFFCRRKSSGVQGDCRDHGSAATGDDRSSCILSRIFSSKDTRKNFKNPGEEKESGTTSQLRRLLRMDLRITAWDLDSTMFAQQLTLIDRDLFLRIPVDEIETLVFQRSSRNSPNIGAWIAFSHRISSLTSSEILATKKLDMRTRIMARFINAADKCQKIGNFHSCRSILAGLQSPGIYRLKATWSRLRTHHSTRYEVLGNLCKIYKSTTSRSYRRAWARSERRPPYLPYVGDLFARILADEETSKSPTYLAWKDRPCNSTGSDASTAVKKFDTVIPKNSIEMKNTSTCNGIAVEPRRSLGRKILSAAMMKIRCSNSRQLSVETEKDDSYFTVRERILARKVCTRWRRFVSAARILACRRAKLESMDPKRRKIVEISEWITECQRYSQGYEFAGHSLAWEFLLKARYREDRENFFISLKLEPPCG